MAAPVDAGRVGTNITTAGTSHAINVGSPSAGDLLIVFVRINAAPGTITFDGYTQLATDTSDASDDTTRVYWRRADGTEGATDTLTTGSSIKLCAVCWRVTGAEDPSINPPNISTVAVGTTTANTANPNSVAPDSPPRDVLYLAMAAGDGEVGAYTGTPSNYTNLVTANSGTGSAASTNSFMGGASRQITNSSSDDPGAFTHGAHTTGWTAFTVAIWPHIQQTVYGATTLTVTAAITVAGIIPTRAGHVAFAQFQTPQRQPTTYYGATTLTATAAIAVNGVRTTHSATTLTVTNTRVVNGVRTTHSATTLTTTASITVNGGRKVFGAFSLTVTAGITVNGNVAAASRAGYVSAASFQTPGVPQGVTYYSSFSLTANAAISVNGVRTTHSATTLTVTAAITVNGTSTTPTRGYVSSVQLQVPGVPPAQTYYGAVSLTTTVGITTIGGPVTARGAVFLTVTVNIRTGSSRQAAAGLVFLFGDVDEVISGGLVTPISIVHARAFGAPLVSSPVTVVAPSVVHARAFGTARLGQFIVLFPITHPRAFGTPSLSYGTMHLLPSSIVHSRAWGSPNFQSSAPTLFPSSIVHNRGFGMPRLWGPGIPIAMQQYVYGFLGQEGQEDRDLVTPNPV